MGYTATTDTLDHITAMVAQERPEWEPGLVKYILQSHAGQVTGSDLAIAALRAAQNRNLPSPKAIGWRGPHWDGLATKPADQVSPEWCGICGRREPECYSVRGPDDDHVFEPVRSKPRVIR